VPEAGDAYASIGYLIAAAVATVGGLGVYAVMLVARYRATRARYQQLQTSTR
jgi:hypothetical protein